MYRVRYYNQTFHPDHFRNGARGWFIVCLNWLRWRLETYVQRNVLKWLAKNGGIPAERMGALSRIFNLDVKAEILEKETTSPKTLKVDEYELPQFIPTRAERYKDGAQRSALNDAKAEADAEGLPNRPVSINDMAARYASQPRQRRYARGRKFTLLDPDGDFESVPSATGKLIPINGEET